MQVRLPNRRNRQEDEPKKTTGGRNRERRVSVKRRRTRRGRGSKTRWRGRGGKPGGGRKATEPKEETSEEGTEGERNRRKTG